MMKVDPIKCNAVNCTVLALLRECQSLIEDSDLRKDYIGMTLYYMIGHVSDIISDSNFSEERRRE